MDELEARIEALERAVTEGDHDLSELAAEGETRDRLAAVEAELDDLADRVAELEAATQALRGYVGNVRAVNRDIEQRADAALAKAESLESAIVGERAQSDGSPPERDPDTAGQSDGRRATRTSGNASESRTTASATGEERRAGTARDGTENAATASDDPRKRTTGESTRDGHHDAGQHGRCRACGQPTGEQAIGNSATASGREFQSVSGAGAGGTDDPLEGVFEADGGRENGDDGTFDRIRKML